MLKILETFLDFVNFFRATNKLTESHVHCSCYTSVWRDRYKDPPESMRVDCEWEHIFGRQGGCVKWKS